MNVRKANIKDIEQVSKLFDEYRVFYRKESDISAAHNFMKQRLGNEDSEIFVSELDDGNLAGFVQLYPLFSSTRMKKLWLLNDLYVNPEFRGRGVSVALIDRAKQLVVDSGACGMFLETETSNVIGNNLYPRTGFILNEESNYYTWDV